MSPVRITRACRTLAIATASLALLLAAAPAALAAPPVIIRFDDSSPTELPAGAPCAVAVQLDSPLIKGHDTIFAAASDGSSRLLEVGSGVSRVTNLATGASMSIRGGVQFTFRTAADGSVRVDARGTNFFAWYLPGDDAELGPGLFQVSGTVTEWYAPDGSFIRATYQGTARDLCAAIGA